MASIGRAGYEGLRSNASLDQCVQWPRPGPADRSGLLTPTGGNMVGSARYHTFLVPDSDFVPESCVKGISVLHFFLVWLIKMIRFVSKWFYLIIDCFVNGPSLENVRFDHNQARWTPMGRVVPRSQKDPGSRTRRIQDLGS